MPYTGKDLDTDDDFEDDWDSPRPSDSGQKSKIQRYSTISMPFASLSGSMRRVIRAARCKFMSKVIDKYARYIEEPDFYHALRELSILSHRVAYERTERGNHPHRLSWDIDRPIPLRLFVSTEDYEGKRYIKPLCIEIHFMDEDG